MKKLSWKLFLLVGILVVLAMACNLSGNTDTIFPPTPQVAVEVIQPTPQISQQLPTIITDEDQVLIALYDRVNPAVVNIITYTDQGGALFPSGQGSGFVYDLDGHIVTNAHVVHGADDIEVIFSDNTTRRAEVVGEDLHSDLAVIKVDSQPAEIQPLTMGDIDSIAVGQTVVALGNPFGLGGTLTRGIVSALGRTIPALTPFSIPQAIQTDAPINPGNSGGPLLNLSGEVIGVNAQIETDGESRANSGVGFAIPVSIVKRVIPVLIDQGEFQWAWLGVRGTSLTPTVVEAMDLPFDKGAYMIEVIDGGPSDKARLSGASEQVTVDGRLVDIGGDVITAIDGQPITSFEDLLIYISLNGSPGQDVTVSIWRNGEYQDITIQLEKRPSTDSFFTLPE
jgi:2-alkenal reductase